MARIPNGILGDFVGTAGPVSGYMRMDTNFVRSRRRRSNRPMTEKRLAQQQKIKVCNEFTSAFSRSGFFDATFRGYSEKTATGYNKATSALLKKAITGTYPGTALAWPLVLISEGGMPSATDAAAVAGGTSNIIFTWSNNRGTGSAKDTDKAVLVAYFTSVKRAVFLISDSRRANCQAILNIPVIGDNVAQTWLGFISDDSKDAADSVYTGQVEL